LVKVKYKCETNKIEIAIVKAAERQLANIKLYFSFGARLGVIKLAIGLN